VTVARAVLLALVVAIVVDLLSGARWAQVATLTLFGALLAATWAPVRAGPRAHLAYWCLAAALWFAGVASLLGS
jgi:hypothetical protein